MSTTRLEVTVIKLVPLVKSQQVLPCRASQLVALVQATQLSSLASLQPCFLSSRELVLLPVVCQWLASSLIVFLVGQTPLHSHRRSTQSQLNASTSCLRLLSLLAQLALMPWQMKLQSLMGTACHKSEGRLLAWHHPKVHQFV